MEKPTGSSRWDLLLVLLLGGHLVWVFSHFLPITVGPDAGGLFVQARLLATELTTGFRPESPLEFLGSHWIETLDGDFHSRYPPGYPLVLAVAYALGGPKAPFFLNPILATIVVGLTYMVGRRFLGRGWAFVAALLVSVLPILNRLTLHGDAHLAVTALLLGGIGFLFRWDDGPTRSRAFLAGLAFGLLPFVRYPEAVVGLAVLAYFGARRWCSSAPAGAVKESTSGSEPGQETVPSSGGFFTAALGASLPLLALGIYNAWAYGAPWRTGYGFTNEQFAFGAGNLGANLPTYLGPLLTGEAGILVIPGLVGLVWMALRRATRARGVLLLVAALSLTLLYGAYYWGAQEESELILRYFMSTFPLFALGATWLAREAPVRKVSGPVFALAAAFFLFRAVPSSSQALIQEWIGVARGHALVEATVDAVPSGAVLIARREVQDVLDYFGRWRLVDDRMMPGAPAREEATLVWELSDADRARLAHVPTPVQITKAVEARARYVGLSDQELARLVLKDMEEWAGSENPVFWLGQPSAIAGFTDVAGPDVQASPILEIEMPGWGGGTVLPAWVPKAPMVLFRIETIPTS
jgi:hypothetical protein